jgi:FK506-binding protein 6
MARLCEPIKLRELTEEGIVFQVDSNNVRDHDSSSDEDNTPDLLEGNLQYFNKECVGVFDEDDYQEGEPFELIAKKMFDLVPDGRIKKRIIRKGDGEKPKEFATVRVNYNGYLEYDDEPFDSTYMRKRPLKYTLGGGKIIAGLDFAIQSMILNEKAQFLIHPDYAYGKNCLVGRVPPNATVLFEVELFEIVNCGAAITFESLPEDQQKMFSEVYKYCTALCERGKKSFLDQDIKSAIKDYNIAVSKLERVMLTDNDEVNKHHELALKLYTNLLICYTRIGEPRKGCCNAKKIYDLTESGELMKVSAKVYFNHAKCLRILSEYDNAKAILDKAYKLEPRNLEIANEIFNLENDKLEHKKKQKIFAKALVGNN